MDKKQKKRRVSIYFNTSIKLQNRLREESEEEMMKKDSSSSSICFFLVGRCGVHVWCFPVISILKVQQPNILPKACVLE